MWSSFRRRAANLIAGRSTSKAKQPPTSEATTKTKIPPPPIPPPSIEVEKALGRSSLRGTNAARAAASDALERASLSLESTVGEVRAGVEQSIGRGKEALQQSIKERTSYADQLRRSASETVERSKRHLNGRISSTASTASQEVYRKSFMAKKEIASRAATAADAASRSAPKVASAASSAASQNVKYAAETFINEARNTRDKALTWLWWWGLAAVGVYGFATAVPRELIRYASLQTGKGEQDKKTKEIKDEDKGEAGDVASEVSSDWKNTIGKLFRSAGGGGWA